LSKQLKSGVVKKAQFLLKGDLVKKEQTAV